MTRLVALAFAVTVLLLPTAATATPDALPGTHWRTLQDGALVWHFNARSRDTVEVLRPLAARAVSELTAWTGTRPSQPIHIVVNTDNDFTNGLTTVMPRNTIRLYPRPPRRPSLLQPTNDWLGLLLVHEMLHVWHLDQHRMPATLFRKIFGRVLLPTIGINGTDWPIPVAVFPNALLPDTLTEGYAVLTESRLMGGLGRANSPEARTLIGNMARDRGLPAIGDAIGFRRAFPAGGTPYLLGGAFHEWLLERDPDAWRTLYDANALGVPPVFWGLPAVAVWDAFPADLWNEWRQAQYDAAAPETTSIPAAETIGTWQDLRALAPGPGRGIYATIGDGRRAERIVAIDPDGQIHHLARRHGGGGISVGPTGLWFDELLPDRDTTRISRITHLVGRDRETLPTARAFEPDYGSNGVAAVTRDGMRECLTVLAPTDGSLRHKWCAPPGRSVQQPRWSPDGRRIVAGIWSTATRFDLFLWEPESGEPPRALTRLPGDEVDAIWYDSRTILFSATRSGRPELYAVRVHGTVVHRLSDVPTGVWQFTISTDGHLWYAAPGADGWTLRRTTAPLQLQPLERAPALPVSSATANTLPKRWPVTTSARYQAWRTLAPTGWQPLLYAGKARRNRYGVKLGGDDAVGLWHWRGSLLADHQARIEGDLQLALTRGAWLAASRYASSVGYMPSITSTALHLNEIDWSVGRFWRGANHRFRATVAVGGNWTNNAAIRELEYSAELADESRLSPAWALEPVQGVHAAIGGGSEISLRHGWRDGRIGARFVTGSFLVGRVQWRAQAAGLIDVVPGHHDLNLAAPGAASPGTRRLVGRGVPTTAMTDLTSDCAGTDICGVQRAGVASAELLLPLWWIQRGVRTLPLWFDEIHLRPFLAGARFHRPGRTRDDLFAGGELLLRMGLGSLALFEPLGVGIRWPVWPRRSATPDVWLSTTISFDRQPLGVRMAWPRGEPRRLLQ
ncbi:MAG: hypothetical protein D6761_07885 [Candidatus Dadabacteria bacterium]|nr:MAG: hypothetical protein D6761_07885 [Candidatus Dadabacteria bacterium]